MQERSPAQLAYDCLKHETDRKTFSWTDNGKLWTLIVQPIPKGFNGEKPKK